MIVDETIFAQTGPNIEFFSRILFTCSKKRSINVAMDSFFKVVVRLSGYIHLMPCVTRTPPRIILRTADSTADNPSYNDDGMKLLVRAPDKLKSTTTWSPAAWKYLCVSIEETRTQLFKVHPPIINVVFRLRTKRSTHSRKPLVVGNNTLFPGLMK